MNPALNMRPSIADQFRHAIATATSGGAALDQLVLILTAGDADKLKRDPAVGVSDISFAGGDMRYLGVKVRQGGVTVSALKHADEVDPETAVATQSTVKKHARRKATPAGA